MSAEDFYSILEMAEEGRDLNRNQAAHLMRAKNGSKEFHDLISLADRKTREEFGGLGYLFGQVGINGEPCSADCYFCSMGASHYSMDSTFQKTNDEVAHDIGAFIRGGVTDFFLMITADYPNDKFLETGALTRKQIPQGARLVANMGDFDKKIAHELKETGFTGAYHIHRLGEGTDNLLDPAERIKTMEAIVEEGLELYYCVEPIGPEHPYEMLADEMIRARDFGVGVMAVMRRIPVQGTPLYEKGTISAIELTKIAAVARLVTKPTRAMNAHEPTPMSLLAGVNQLYAEIGANPRDTKSDTEQNRGYAGEEGRSLLEEAGFTVAELSPVPVI